MGHHSFNHHWDMRGCSLLLLTPAWARGTYVSPRVLHKHLLLRRWAAWVEVKAGTFRTQGHVYAVVPQTELADQSDVQGTFRVSHFLTRMLFKFGCIIFMLIVA